MKTLTKSLLTVTLGSFISAPAISATANGVSTANIVPSLQLAETAPLAFGTFASAATANVVAIDASDCSATDNLPHFGGHGCGKFNVTGYKNAAYTVSWDQNIDLIGQSDSNTGESMPATIILDGDPVKSLKKGKGEMQFGGSLQVSANQAKGAYEGSYKVTVNYQ